MAVRTAGTRLIWSLGTVAAGAEGSKQVVVTVSAGFLSTPASMRRAISTTRAPPGASAGAVDARKLAALSENSAAVR